MPRFSSARLAMAALVVGGILMPAALLAQVETGTIAGTVSDGTGARLPGVTITVRNLATSQVRTAVTNAAGRYHIAALQPSRYMLRAELQGFGIVERPEVTVNIASTVDIDFTMAVAGLETTVTVTTEAPIVERNKTDLSDVITTQQLETLPSKARQYLDYVLLLPATVENVSTTQQGSGLNIGGSRAKEAALLVDGFYNMDEGFGLPRQRHSQEAIQEFQVVSFGGSAEHGRAIGGIVNAITKSGGNRFSGSVYGYFRNKELNAQDPGERRLGVAKSDFDRQEWGGTFGGPIIREKTFFFAAYDRVKENYGFANSIRASDAARIGLPAEDIGALPRFYRLNFAMAKIDHHVNANHKLQASVAMSRWTEFDINTATPLGTRSQQQRLAATDWSYIVKWTGIGSGGRVLHDLKASYFPRYYNVGGVSEGGPPLTPDGQINVGNQSTSSPPRVSIASVATFGSAATNAKLITHPVQMLYSLSIFKNRHSFKFGADYMYSHLDLNSYQRLKGNYTFSSLDNFLAGRYANYSQSFGDPHIARGHHYISGFAQDSWEVSDRLTMNYGLRYDLELHPKHPATGERLGEDYNNIYPRLGLSYDLTNKGTTFLKVASGLYADRLYQRLSTWYPDLKDHAQLVSATWRPQDPGAPVYPAVFATKPPNLPGSVINAWVMPDELRTPTSGQFVGTFEHALTPNLAVSTSVVYTRSWNKEHQFDANLVFDEGRQAWVRPDRNYRMLQQYQFDGKAEYVGGVFEITKRGGRVGFTANATVARSYDSGNTGDNFPNDQRLGIEADWGPSADTPTLRGVVSGWFNLTSDFQVSGVFRARGGMAVTPTAAGLDLNGDQRLGDRTPTFDRNRIRTPSNSSLDLRVTWARSIGASAKMHLYLEGFNILDQENIRTVITDYGPDPANPKPRWLEPLTYFPPREVQLGARLTF
jgi:hypothetical protein